MQKHQKANFRTAEYVCVQQWWLKVSITHISWPVTSWNTRSLPTCTRSTMRTGENTVAINNKALLMPRSEHQSHLYIYLIYGRSCTTCSVFVEKLCVVITWSLICELHDTMCHRKKARWSWRRRSTCRSCGTRGRSLKSTSAMSSKVQLFHTSSPSQVPLVCNRLHRFHWFVPC